MISGRSTVCIYLIRCILKSLLGHEKRPRLPRFQKSDVSRFVVTIVPDHVHLNSHTKILP